MQSETESLLSQHSKSISSFNINCIMLRKDGEVI